MITQCYTDIQISWISSHDSPVPTVPTLLKLIIQKAWAVMAVQSFVRELALEFCAFLWIVSYSFYVVIP